MAYNPIIAAARRAAKQLSRETGEPYQATLDAVARQAGRKNWDDYLGAPVAIAAGTTSPDGMYFDGTEHRSNTRNFWMTGLGTMPALLVLPHAFGRDPMQSVHLVGTMAAFWLVGLMIASMFFDMLALHPQIPDEGKNQKRQRNTAEDLAGTGVALSALALVAGFLAGNGTHGDMTLVAILASIGLAAGGIVLTASDRIASRNVVRIMSIISVNGCLAAGLLAISILIQR